MTYKCDFYFENGTSRSDMSGSAMASESSRVQESSVGSCTDCGEDFAPSKLGTKE